jgi:hypothetical protein
VGLLKREVVMKVALVDHQRHLTKELRERLVAALVLMLRQEEFGTPPTLYRYAGVSNQRYYSFKKKKVKGGRKEKGYTPPKKTSSFRRHGSHVLRP